MTFLKHYQACPRSGYFYAAHKGAMQNDAMVRGSALHTILERAVNLMIEQGEQTIPPELVKALVNEVLAEDAVPFAEHDYMREAAYRWAAEWTVDPAAVIACEQLVVLELGGWQVRGKVDFAEAQAGGMVVRVADWKSSRAAPAYEEIARKRADGSLAAKNFQLVLYALLLAFGVPVREEWAECDTCGGDGFAQNTDARAPCEQCAGEGKVRHEIAEPLPLAQRAEQFDLSLIYPGIKDREGLMLRRSVSLTRLELGEYRESLAGLMARVERSELQDDWPAVISDEGCSECPCRPLCPIPNELRDHAGAINTLEQAAEASEVLDRRDDQNRALRKEIKLFAKARNLEIRYGADKAWRFVVSETERIPDKEEMWAAVDRAAQYGEPFQRADYVKTTNGTNFTAVRLTADELEEERNAQG